MKISIIGSGNMAHGIGTRIVTSTHMLTIYDKSLQKAKDLSGKLGPNVQAKELGNSLEGDIVIFALPYLAISEVIENHKKSLEDKILVDISNPVNFETFELIPPSGTSGAEEIAKNLPASSKLLKAFNTTFAGTLTTGGVDGKKLDVFIAGDDKDAKDALRKMIEDSGMRALDAGPLSNARHLEGIQLIHMKLQATLGNTWTTTLKILP